MDMSKIISNFLCDYLEKKRITKMELASELDVSVYTLVNLMNGKTKSINAITFNKIISFLVKEGYVKIEVKKED